MRRYLGFGLVLILVALGTGLLTPTPATSGDPFRVVFSSDVFASVNKNDALASTKAWIHTVGLRHGLDLEVYVGAYEDEAELREMIRNHEADLFIANAMHYVEMEDESPDWEALFVPQHGEFVLEEYIMLVHKDRIGGLAGLRGGSMLVLKTTGAKMASDWLDSYLADRGLGGKGNFFSSVRVGVKPSTTILPVFFGQADACVVDRSSFDLMTELNPQIGANLKVVAESEPYLEAVLCLHNQYQHNREEVLEGLSELHDVSAGQQMMMVFKIDRLVPFETEFLESVRALRDAGRSPLEAAAR